MMVLPMKGTQWKTTGGSCGFLNSSWLSTLRIMASTTKATSAEPTTMPVDLLESCSDTGPARVARRPMIAERSKIAGAKQRSYLKSTMAMAMAKAMCTRKFKVSEDRKQ